LYNGAVNSKSDNDDDIEGQDVIIIIIIIITNDYSVRNAKGTKQALKN